MLVSLLEPIGVSADKIEELAAPIRARGCDFVYFNEPTKDPVELARRAGQSDVVIIANTPYPRETIEADERLKLVDVAFTGVDLVDAEACRERGVTVCNCAGYADRAVAELALGLAIDCLRSVVAGDEAVRRGGTSAGLMGSELAGKRVGILGTGRIGRAAGALFKALGCEVAGYARHESPEATALGIEPVSFDELLRTSDVLSLHVPLTPATRGLIGAEQLAAMKPTAVLVNCARGPVVDARALADALERGVIGAAAIDVFDREPPLAADDPLLKAPRCTLTPHVGYLTAEAMERRAKIAFENVCAFLDGAPQNVQVA